MSLHLPTRRALFLQASVAGLTDSFNRADSAITLGSADTGQAWTAHAGTWGISGNSAYCVSDTHADLATADAGIADGTWQIIINGDLTNYRIPQLVFRGLDASNYLLYYIYGGNAILYKSDAGAFTLLGTGVTTTTSGVDYTLKVVCSGNAMEFFVDGVSKLTHTLAGGDTKYNAYTRVGLRLGKSGSPVEAGRWDTLSVQP